jgi:probable phosphoglycerate mutase
MDLYIVRHGQTWANIESRYLGALDPGLTDLGRQQAQALAEQLPAHVQALITSPLLRARQTADYLNQQHRLPICTMDAFRERHVGVFEGLTQAEAKARHSGLWAQNITRQWDIGPDGGESIKDVFLRVQQGLQFLLDAYHGKVVVLVAHGFVAKTIRALARGDCSDFYNWQLGNGEVLALENLQLRGQIHELKPVLQI